MVHLNPRWNLFAGVNVVNDDVTGKQFGHAGGVVLDDELLQLYRKRQLLQQNSVRLAQHRRAGLCALSHQQVGAKRRVVFAQTVLGFDIGHHAAACVGGLAVEPHLGTHDQVPIKQTAQAHQHDCTVRRQIANLVGSTGLGGHHPAGACTGITLLELDLPAAARQHPANAPGGGLG